MYFLSTRVEFGQLGENNEYLGSRMLNIKIAGERSGERAMRRSMDGVKEDGSELVWSWVEAAG